MKENRNCGYSYPPAFMPGPLPITGVNMPMPMPIGGPTTYSGVNYDNSLASQISSLEKRISNIENMLGNSSYSSTSYNTTNYQMM